jgi:uncharacterized membrane protein YoaK (UPF0700 family)
MAAGLDGRAERLAEPAVQREAGWRLASLAVVLSAAAGATDAFSFLRLGNVFTSVMTGNLVLLGLGVGAGLADQIINTGVAFVAFLLGLAGGSRIARPSPGADPGLMPQSVVIALGAELAAFGGLLCGWQASGPHPGNTARLLLLVAAAAAMGIQSAATRQIRVKGLSTTYFTSTIASVVESLSFADRQLRARSVIQLFGLAAGAGMSALLVTGAPRFAPALQCGLLAIVILGALLPHPACSGPAAVGSTEGVSGKKMEGNEEQRRAAARQAREHGSDPSAAGVSTGASKQRHHLPRHDDHEQKIDAPLQGKQHDPDRMNR